MVLLGCALAALPGILLLGGAMIYGLHPLMIAPFVTAVYVGISAILSMISGELYASFNPSE